jgi:fructokinase
MAPRPNQLFSIGVDVGGTKLEAIVLDPAGVERWRERVPTPRAGYDATLRAIVDLVQRARQSLHGAPCTIGIGAPGHSSPQGLMKNCNSTQLNGRPMRSDLELALGQAVRLSNDANCLVMSEATDGAGAGSGVVFAAILGTGVGAGIAVHGRVLSGPNGLAGEWGHNPLPWAASGDDPQFGCYCGQRGCIETLLSGPGLAREHRHFGGADLSAAQIAAAADAGDPACQATLQRYVSRLARALASVINLLDPDVIVLAGGLSNIELLYQQVPRLWGRWVVSGGLQDIVRTRLLPSRHGDASGVRGAAWLWRDPAAPQPGQDAPMTDRSPRPQPM